MKLAHMSWANGIHEVAVEICQLFLVKVTIEKIIDIKLINNPAIGPMDKKVQILVGSKPTTILVLHTVIVSHTLFHYCFTC